MFEWFKKKKKNEQEDTNEVSGSEEINVQSEETDPSQQAAEPAEGAANETAAPSEDIGALNESAEVVESTAEETNEGREEVKEAEIPEADSTSSEVLEEVPAAAQMQVAETAQDVPAKEAEPEVVKKKKPGFFSKFFNNLFSSIDDDFYDELEEQLIMGDMGVYATEELLDNLKDEVTLNKIRTSADAKDFLIKDIKRIMTQPADAYDFENQKSVVMLIGVNGVGKTTCVGKLASRYIADGRKVIMAGADTFRAAAMDQLKIWAERTNCFMISGNEGADPGSVIFDAAKSAKARGADILLCDTAGRLHNKKNLMNELAKLDKILKAELADFKRENIIVLDATTGQNALAQAKEFKEVMHIDGIILTKLDGTAKGGIAVAITRELGVPVKYIGVGEGVGDLKRFDPDSYVEGLFAE